VERAPSDESKQASKQASKRALGAEGDLMRGIRQGARHGTLARDKRDQEPLLPAPPSRSPFSGAREDGRSSREACGIRDEGNSIVLLRDFGPARSVPPGLLADKMQSRVPAVSPENHPRGIIRSVWMG